MLAFGNLVPEWVCFDMIGRFVDIPSAGAVLYRLLIGGFMAKQVLVIEDEPNIVEAISFILSRDGWTVTTHVDGKSAADVVLEAMPDVLVLDVMLPGRSGFDILQELRANPKTRRLPVLMLTARGQRTDRERAEGLGVNCFMTKPFSNSEVLQTLNELVRG